MDGNCQFAAVVKPPIDIHQSNNQDYATIGRETGTETSEIVETDFEWIVL